MARRYQSGSGSHLLPYFGKRKLTEIRPLDVQVFLNQKANKYTRSGLQHMKATLSRMFSDAVAWGYLRENPVRNVKLPHARLTPPQPYLTAEQVRSLVFKIARALPHHNAHRSTNWPSTFRAVWLALV